MIIRKLAAVAAMLMLNPLGWADASYQSTTRMTGGSLVRSVSGSPFAPAGAKEVIEPRTTITVVHGNQKAVISKDRTEIYDIDKQTITRINNLKKTYTVTTFAQMRQMMKDMPQKLAAMQARQNQMQASGQPTPDYKTTFDSQVKSTGATKVVNGLTAQEWVVTVTSKTAAANAPTATPLTYVTTTEVWVAPEPPEVAEVHEFDKRMYTKMEEGLDMQALQEQMQSANGGTGMMFAHQPGASDAMLEMSRQIAQIKGIRVLEVTTMRTSGMPVMTAGSAPPATTPSGGSVVGQVATDTATQTASGESSKMGVFGGALANSALGAFRRKKATPPPAAAPPAPAPGGGSSSDADTLMTTTKEMNNFSHDPAPPSAFLVPDGFKQVSPNGEF